MKKFGEIKDNKNEQRRLRSEEKANVDFTSLGAERLTYDEADSTWKKFLDAGCEVYKF